MFNSVTVRHIFTPAIVNTQGANPTASSYVITPSVAPTEGNLILVIFGASTSPGISSVPTGFNTAGGSTASLTTYLFYKTVTASEPSTYTFTFAGSVSGGYFYGEFSGLQNYSAPIALNNTGGSIAASTSYVIPTFSVTTPGIVVSFMGKSTTSAWNPGGGWTLLSAAGQQKAAYKTYTDIATGQTMTWTGTSASVSHALVLFRSKDIRF